MPVAGEGVSPVFRDRRLEVTLQKAEPGAHEAVSSQKRLTGSSTMACRKPLST